MIGRPASAAIAPRPGGEESASSESVTVSATRLSLVFDESDHSVNGNAAHA